MLDLLSNLFRAIAELFGFRRQRSEARNAPDVKAAKDGQREADKVSEVEDMVKHHDVDGLRKELGE